MGALDGLPWRLKRSIRRLKWDARGRQDPQGAAAFDAQYERGDWAFLENLAELAHHSVIAGYCAHVAARSVLDIGCGAGMLTPRLRHPELQSYVGIDFSAAAIGQAVAAAPSASFEVADAVTYQPARRFDVIVCNEVLYYLDDPLAVVRRYLDYLEPRGHFIVSVHDRSSQNGVWTEIGKALAVRDSVTLTNGDGVSWRVKLMQPA